MFESRVEGRAFSVANIEFKSTIKEMEISLFHEGMGALHFENT